MADSVTASTSTASTSRAPQGRVDSSDSLSSAVSAGSESPKGGTAARIIEVPQTRRESFGGRTVVAAASKKLSTPYPPPYVPSLPAERWVFVL